MTAPATNESQGKNQQTKQADELQDRIVDLREQEQQIQREMAERREQEALQAFQKEREKADRQRQEQAEALNTIGRQADDGVQKVETGTQDAARGSAMIAATLLPPAMSQPALLVDATYNSAISALTFQRDFFKNLLSTGRQAVGSPR